MNFFLLCLTTNFAKTDAGTLTCPRGGGAAAGGGEGQNGEGETYKYTKFTTPTLKVSSRAMGAKRAEKIGSKEKKAKTKNL